MPSGAMAYPRALRRFRGPTAFFVGVAGLGLIDAFALLRPLASAGPYYGPRPHASGYSYTWFLLAAFPAYALALVGARREDGPARRTVLLAAAVLAAPLVFAPLIQSQDLYQYLFYARMQLVHGANPYLVEPVAFAHDPWFGYLAWPGQVSVYGPLWSLAMACVAWVSGASLVHAMLLAKGLALGLGALAIWGLVRLAEERRPGTRLAPAAVAAFALNPLVLSTVALSGHADVGVAAAIVWAMVADRRGHTGLSALLLGAATLVKAYAGFALVAYLIAAVRREDTRAAARSAIAPAALAVLTFAPYWRGMRTFTGVAGVAGGVSSSLAGVVARTVSDALGLLGMPDASGVALAAVRVAGALAVLAVLVRVARRPAARDPWEGVMAVMVTYVLVTPWFLPWHALGALAVGCAMLDSPLSLPTLVFSGSCLASIGVPGLVGPLATAVVRYGSPALVFARGRKQSRGRRRSAPRLQGSG